MYHLKLLGHLETEEAKGLQTRLAGYLAEIKKHLETVKDSKDSIKEWIEEQWVEDSDDGVKLTSTDIQEVARQFQLYCCSPAFS
jgi:hypothetical protein